jgi:penicillin-binding protein 1A
MASYQDFFQNGLEKLNNAYSWVKSTIRPITQPVTQKISQWLAPVKAFFQPWVEKLNPYTAPIRARWQAFSTAYPRASNITRWIGYGMGAFFGFFLLLTLMIQMGFFGGLPSSKELRNVQNQTAAEIYSSDNSLLGRYYIVNRTNTTFDEISPNVVNALIATEDVRFYEHSGVDYRSWLRVIFKSVLMQDESSGGGSTISQQLAKNLYPRKRIRFVGMIVNKLREFLIARKLEGIYEKNDLMTLYLNTVPFSKNVYGIEIASQRFFGKKPKVLTVDEAAVLVGMLKATSIYDPVRNQDKALERRNTVLAQMHKYNKITDKEYKAYLAEPITLKYTPESISEGPAPYFREALRQEVDVLVKNFKKKDGTPFNVYTDGLKIYTTIDASMQAYAEQTVEEHMKKHQKNFYSDWKYADDEERPWKNDTILEAEMWHSNTYKMMKAQNWSDKGIKKKFLTDTIDMNVFDWNMPNHTKTLRMTRQDSLRYYMQLLNAGFLAMEPNSGAIKAWVGGIDHNYFKYDHAKQAKRQVGSIFKPIVYASALKSGISPCDYFTNYRRNYHEWDDWMPENSEDDEYGGSYSMRGALRKSLNVISAQLIMKAGIPQTAELAEKMGITSKVLKVPAISLGTVDATLYDMMKVYGTFANRGYKPEPYYISRIETSGGDVLYENKPKPVAQLERILTQDEADIMTELLRAVVDEGTGEGMRHKFDLHNEMGGKTGTTQNQADGWFMCFTPNIVCGAWAGAVSPKVHFQSMDYGQGSAAALPMCGGFLKKVYADAKFKDMYSAKFPRPSGEVYDRMSCPDYVSDSSYVDTLGERHLVPGSGLRRRAAREEIQQQQQDERKQKQKVDQLLKEVGSLWNERKLYPLGRKEIEYLFEG